MKAHSLLLTSDGVAKTTADASEQVAWLGRAADLPLAAGIRPVRVLGTIPGGYVMEHVPGPVLADERDRQSVREHTTVLLSQIEAWSTVPADNDASWSGYLRRLETHAATGSPLVRRATDVARDFEPFPRSWCHGDLTLENVLCAVDGTVLIDPNYSPELYQSHVLDYGKILQSTRTAFHRTISPRSGDLEEAGRVAEAFLRERDLYEPALRACLTHAVRLVRHWLSHADAVESLIADLLEEVAP